MKVAPVIIEEKIISSLRSITGVDGILTDHERMTDYSHDEYAMPDLRHLPDAVAKPADTAQVAAILKLCNSARIPVTTRGGATGLCGGCVPVSGGLLLSMERMNRIVEIDRQNMTAIVESGLTLMDFYKALENSGLFFPPHPGDESATMGGVIATNAGGSRAIKYGVVRNFVKGVEAVLPDGTILDVGGKFIKNSSGYSLLHLLTGSEGTLAVITKAVFTLMPPPVSSATLVAPFERLHDAISSIPEILQSGIIPLAAEFMEDRPVRLTESCLDRRWPAARGNAHLMFIVDGASEEEALLTAEKISGICMRHKALDVFIADTKQKQENILSIRSKMYDALKSHMVEDLDVVVPRAVIADFVKETAQLADELGLWIPTYGHAADGNVHHHLMRAAWKDGTWTEIPCWKERCHEASDRIHALGRRYHGAASGEHGIGLAKKRYLADFIGPEQIRLMKGIKKVFDPNNILNPGKIFD